MTTVSGSTNDDKEGRDVAAVDGRGRPVSGYEAWVDVDGTHHIKVTLTTHDALSMGPSKYGALLDAAKDIEWAFKPEDDS